MIKEDHNIINVQNEIHIEGHNDEHHCHNDHVHVQDNENKSELNNQDINEHNIEEEQNSKKSKCFSNSKKSYSKNIYDQEDDDSDVQFTMEDELDKIHEGIPVRHLNTLSHEHVLVVGSRLIMNQQ